MQAIRYHRLIEAHFLHFYSTVQRKDKLEIGKLSFKNNFIIRDQGRRGNQ